MSKKIAFTQVVCHYEYSGASLVESTQAYAYDLLDKNLEQLF